MMSVQELIDLPGYGRARDVLISEGRWLVTATDSERIDWIAENVSVMKHDSSGEAWSFDMSEEGCDPDTLREEIDNASANQYRGDRNED